MMKFFSFVLLAIIAMPSFSQKIIKDPNAQVRSVSGYHGVSISGSIELFLTQGEEESVAVSAAETKWLDYIITEVKDGVLHIYWKKRNNIEIGWGNNPKKIKAYVSIKQIDYLSSSGSGKVHIEGKLSADKLKLNISGSGNLNGAVAVKDLTAGISGSGNIQLSGTSEKSKLSVSGSGNISSYDLATDYCNVSTSGSGNIRVTVNKELSARTSGSGNIYVKGEGLIRDFSSSGSGKFKRVS
jgi:Putative auto-transporter adhesin, head GIN domain